MIMRSRIIIISCILFSFIGFSQDKLSTLTFPTSPAASATGIQPAEILRPKSYQALETALYSNFFDGSEGVVIPKDFALEFTPFWSADHGLSLSEYLFPTFGQQFIRNSSFSIASTQSFTLGDSSKISGIGFGYRVSFFGNNKDDKIKIHEMENDMHKQQSFYSKIVSQLETDPEISPFDPTVFKRKIQSIIMDLLFSEQIYNRESQEEKKEANSLIDQILREIDKIKFNPENLDAYKDEIYLLIDGKLMAQAHFDEFKEYLKSRHGFALDIAYSAFLSFPSGNFQFSYIPHQYFWLSPNYQLKNKLDFLNFSGVLRYSNYNLNFYDAYFQNHSVFSNNLDYGFGLSANFKLFNVQFELIGRNGFGFIKSGIDIDGEDLYKWKSSSDVQYLATFNYNINQSLVMTYTIGNRFDPIRNPESTFVSTLSLNFGFGAPDSKDITLD